MDAEGIAAERQSVTFVADMRYHGQGYEIPVPHGARRPRVLDERFNALHEQLYGFRMPDTPSEIVNLRAVGTGDRPKPELPEASRASDASARSPTPARSSSRASAADADLRPRRAAARATASPARRSSPSSTRPPSSCPATRPRWTATSTS